MVNLRQSSFRRILVSKILLLTVPVLLIGEFVGYTKARSSLIESAHQNLTESAIIKGENIVNTIDFLKNNLFIASQTTVLQSGQPQLVKQFVTNLGNDLPRQIKCIQLKNPYSGDIITGNCSQKLTNLKTIYSSRNNLKIELILPAKSRNKNLADRPNKLELKLSSPVYDSQGKLRYTLSIQSQLLQEKITYNPGFFKGSTIVVSEKGTILAHPIFQRVGTNIADRPDGKKLQKTIKNAISGAKESSDLFFETEGEQLLAGYAAINNPVEKDGQKWVILAVTSLDNALYGLNEIILILFVLAIGLIGATLLASLYVSRYLARPVEQLRDYALNLHSHHIRSPVPP